MARTLFCRYGAFAPYPKIIACARNARTETIYCASENHVFRKAHSICRKHSAYGKGECARFYFRKPLKYRAHEGKTVRVSPQNLGVSQRLWARNARTKIIYCAFENRVSQKAHSICRILTAYGKRVNFCPFYKGEPLKRAKRGRKRRRKRCKRLNGGVALISRHFAAGGPARNARTNLLQIYYNLYKCIIQLSRTMVL